MLTGTVTLGKKYKATLTNKTVCLWLMCELRIKLILFSFFCISKINMLDVFPHRKQIVNYYYFLLIMLKKKQPCKAFMVRVKQSQLKKKINFVVQKKI
jgi:hypothetical protein